MIEGLTGGRSIDVPGDVTLDAVDLILTAALNGAALAYIDEREAQSYIESGHLVRVLDEWTLPYPGLALYYAGHRHVPAKLRALINHIRRHWS